MPWWSRCLGKSHEPPDVTELDYRHSNLMEVPAEVFAYELTLEKLSLASNQISTLPPSLFHCHELRELELYDNELECIPAAIGSLTRLSRLDASRNGITDVSESIKNCKNLVHLNLSLNHLVKVPEAISQLVGLEELNLTDTCIEYLNANFGKLTKLRVLELRENGLQSLPKSMTRFSHLNRLDLGHNDLHELPEVVGTMPNLQELFLDNNAIRILSSMIGHLSKLSSLDCSSNEIYQVADEICKCIHLGDLNFTANSIEGLPDAFGKLESLTILRLDNNHIQYLPESIGHLKNLQELSMMRNLLKALPPSFGLLRKLQTVMLDDNCLSELPKEIGSCTELSILHVAKNRLHCLPSEMGHLSNLKVLSISGNRLINLPVSILNIPKLGAIWVSDIQSKPMLPFNKEIDPYSGQPVLTCFLLPQLPSTDPTPPRDPLRTEEDLEVVVRKRKATIKFADLVEDPITESKQEVEQGPSTSTASQQRPVGLFRAPTPYPKELRQMAKHASQVYTRHSTTTNGDITNQKRGSTHNMDVDGISSPPESCPNSEIDKAGISETKSVIGGHHSITEQRPPNLNDRELQSRNSHYDSIRRLRQGYVLVNTNKVVNMTEPLVADNTPTTEVGISSWNRTSYSPPVGSDASSSKTPPPYHVAALRAAFLRGNSTTPTPVCVPPLPQSTSQISYDSIKSSKPSPPDMSTPSSLPILNNSTSDSPIAENCLHDAVGKKENIPLTISSNSSVYQTGNPTPVTEQPTLVSREELIDSEVHEREKRIIESIIRDVSTLSTAESVVEEIDMGSDICDGPPILPMKPILGKYPQFRSSSSSLIRNNSETSKIPLFSTSSLQSSPLSKEPDDVIPATTSLAEVGYNGMPRRPKTISATVSNAGTDSASPNIGAPVSCQSKIPKLASGQSMINSKIESHGILEETQQHPVTRFPVKFTDRTYAAGPNTPSFTNPTSKPSFPKQNGPNHRQDSLTTGIIMPPTQQLILDNTPAGVVRKNSVGSKIPKRSTPSPPPKIITTKVSHEGDSSFVESEATMFSSSFARLPSANKKPWIFGSHHNTRVVALEYKKINELGFTICNGIGSSSTNSNGVFVDSIDSPESTVKVGDKLLEVDGIDVSNMNLEIVRKILSNCQEMMNLLVSRHHN